MLRVLYPLAKEKDLRVRVHAFFALCDAVVSCVSFDQLTVRLGS